jgi:hypothetical protein
MPIRPRAACLVMTLACFAWAAPIAAQGAPADEREAAAALDERAEAAAKALEKGLKSKDPGERRTAVLAASDIPHAKVAKALGKAAGDKDMSVRIAAFDALGTLGQEDALEALHRVARKAKQMKDEPAALAALYRAIGRHGAKDSIDVLLDDPWLTMDDTVVKARVYALGNVREVESVEGLFSLMNLARPLPGEDAPFMPHFRVALARLTGTDQTTNKSLWQDWWREHEQGFAVSPEAAPMPAELQQPWDEFWRVDGARGADGRDGGPGQAGEDGADGRPGHAGGRGGDGGAGGSGGG